MQREGLAPRGCGPAILLREGGLPRTEGRVRPHLGGCCRVGMAGLTSLRKSAATLLSAPRRLFASPRIRKAACFLLIAGFLFLGGCGIFELCLGFRFGVPVGFRAGWKFPVSYWHGVPVVTECRPSEVLGLAVLGGEHELFTGRKVRGMGLYPYHRSNAEAYWSISAPREARLLLLYPRPRGVTLTLAPARVPKDLGFYVPTKVEVRADRRVVARILISPEQLSREPVTLALPSVTRLEVGLAPAGDEGLLFPVVLQEEEARKMGK